jgi:hypothetical protein
VDQGPKKNRPVEEEPMKFGEDQQNSNLAVNSLRELVTGCSVGGEKRLNS